MADSTSLIGRKLLQMKNKIVILITTQKEYHFQIKAIKSFIYKQIF